MRLIRYALTAVLLVILGVAIYQTMLWLGYWGNSQESQVRPLADGDQEIAFIEPATSTDDWGRLVTAVQLIEKDWPRLNPMLPELRVDLDGAFPPLTAAVPEITFAFANAPKHKLRLRWYKITGEHSAASWIEKLHARNRPPLAIIGGGTSNRAVDLARALTNAYPDPDKPSPVFIITTATAEKIAEDSLLIKEYPSWSFRFSFTNKRMVEALLKFAKATPSLWLDHTAVQERHVMHAVYWQDERYSKDLTDLFAIEFKKGYPGGEFFDEGGIRYAIGDFFHPAPLEQDAVGTFLATRKPIAPQSFLVLPTQSIRMRRFLINLYTRSPENARNLVILNGDAISFNSVYRDRDAIWNIFDLPFSLVFFAHRNPIDRAAGFREEDDIGKEPSGALSRPTTSGTHDLLLHRDIFEALLYATADQGTLIGNSLKVRERLQATAWHQPAVDTIDDPPRVCNTLIHVLKPEPRRFFSKLGDRRKDTGEHIVWIKPHEDRATLSSKISIWSPARDTNGDVWQLVGGRPLDVRYNQKIREDAVP